MLRSLAVQELLSLGLSQFFIGQLTDYENEIDRLGRVVSITKGQVTIDTGSSIRGAKPDQEAVVGDFCLFSEHGTDEVKIDRILERKSLLKRHSHSKEKAQNICSNVDYIFLVSSMNSEFKLNRVERYLIAIRESGAEPVIILTKKDLCEDPDKFISELKELGGDLPVLMMNALQRDGIDQMQPYLGAGNTVALVGSSGVGKTTLINALKNGGEDGDTQGISFGDRGRHTTTSRELLKLESGALIIDTPGMREFAPVINESIAEVFDDIENLAGQCRYRDCSHTSEPGCQVLKAVSEGHVSQRRFDNYHKLMRHQQRLENPQFREDERKYWKQITKEYRRMKKDGDK